MHAYRTGGRTADSAHQSFVVRTGRQHQPIAGASLQVMRRRDRTRTGERRGFQVWLALGQIRLQVGTR